MRLIDADKLEQEIQAQIDFINREKIMQPDKDYYNLMKIACYNMALLYIKTADTVDVPAVTDAPTPASREVFDELMSCELYRGNYDGTDEKISYMCGIRRVMSSIALDVSFDCLQSYKRIFEANMKKSQERARQ